MQKKKKIVYMVCEETSVCVYVGIKLAMNNPFFKHIVEHMLAICEIPLNLFFIWYEDYFLN